MDACGLAFNVTHKTIQDYIDQIGEPVMNAMFKFSVIRNPWDRTYSWWRFFVAEKVVMPRFSKDFDGWVSSRITAINQMRNLGNTKRPLDQLSYYRDASGGLRIDKFLRFENLDAEFKLIAQKVGAIKPLDNIGGNGKVNSAKLNYRDYYKSQQAIDLVAKLNLELIEKFGYKF